MIETSLQSNYEEKGSIRQLNYIIKTKIHGVRKQYNTLRVVKHGEMRHYVGNQVETFLSVTTNTLKL